MTKEELQKLINDLQNQLKEAQVRLEKLNKHERFKPEEGEVYHYVDTDNRISNTVFDNSFVGDCNKYKAYNCFETKEEAEKEANKILIRRKLEDLARRLNGDEKIDWSNEDQPKYYIVFDDKDNGDYMQKHLFDNVTYIRRTQGTIYCLQPNFLVRAKEEIGKQELIDYIKGE